MTDLRQSPAWAKYLESINWTVEKINGNYYYLKKLPVVGYLLKIQRPSKIDLKAIDKLHKKYKIYKTVIEPVTPLKLKPSKSFYLPTKTIQIDLTKSRAHLLKEMSPKTRYNIKKHTLQITDSTNINEFANFWRKNFERKRFPVLSQKKNIIALYKAFGKNAHILTTHQASLLILIYDKTAYYMYAASNNEGRKLFAPTLLTWHAILLAKKQKCKVFDFDGIYDERFPLKSWQGFTRFKKGFGGKEIEYPGCYILKK
jgi:lipid II:glycine glycyltransferase (peptidoglycan interpeptide bridge formation enzyme)